MVIFPFRYRLQYFDLLVMIVSNTLQIAISFAIRSASSSLRTVRHWNAPAPAPPCLQPGQQRYGDMWYEFVNYSNYNVSIETARTKLTLHRRLSAGLLTIRTSGLQWYVFLM